MMRTRTALVLMLTLICACRSAAPRAFSRVEVEAIVAAALEQQGSSLDEWRVERDQEDFATFAREEYERTIMMEQRYLLGVRVVGSELVLGTRLLGPLDRMAQITSKSAFAVEPIGGELRIPFETHEVDESLRDGLARVRKCMESHSANLAHANEIGYKRLNLHRSNLPDSRSWSQGALEVTERQMDLAIDGNGFFRVRLPDGQIAHTRAGNFNIDAEGNLVTAEGLLFDPQFTISGNTIGITVDATGRIFVIDAETPDTPQEVGQFELTRFINPSGLRATGTNLFLETAASGNPIDGTAGQRDQGFGLIRQGFIENSNVDVVTESVDLVADSRMYSTILHMVDRLSRVSRSVPHGSRSARLAIQVTEEAIRVDSRILRLDAETVSYLAAHGIPVEHEGPDAVISLADRKKVDELLRDRIAHLGLCMELVAENLANIETTATAKGSDGSTYVQSRGGFPARARGSFLSLRQADIFRLLGISRVPNSIPLRSWFA